MQAGVPLASPIIKEFVLVLFLSRMNIRPNVLSRRKRKKKKELLSGQQRKRKSWYFDVGSVNHKDCITNIQALYLIFVPLFSDRPGITNGKKVEAVQEQYLNALLSYERWRRPKKAHFLAKLLLKLVELRSLAAEHSDVLFALKVEKGSLPPLLSEFFYQDNS